MPYIGQPPVSGDTTKSFRLLDNLASFTLTFDATSSSVVDTTANTLTFANHRFVTAQRITYTDGGGTAIGGLTDGTAYFVIKVDQNTIQLASSASNANNSTAISLSAGAAGGSHTLNIAFDGTNTKFKVTYGNGTKAKISRAGQLLISINGVLQQAQESSTPTLGFGLDSDSTIVFSQAPVSTDVLFGQILADTITNFDIQDNTLDVFTGDGSTTGFTLSKKPASNNDILVTLDGVVQYPTTTSTSNAYSVSDNTLTFTSAPADGVAIQVRHIGFAGATSSAVTGLYGRTGNVTLSSSDDDITVGNVTAGIITATSYGSISGTTASFSGNVSIGGTLTYEDVTNIDAVGLITARKGIKVDDLGVQVGTGATVDSAGDNILTFLTNGSERARIDASGRLQIGTTSGVSQLHVQQSAVTSAPSRASALYLENNANCEIQFVGNASNDCQLRFGTTSNSFKGAFEYQLDNDVLLSYVNGSERMRIDSSGRLLLNTTTEGNADADNLTVADSAACGISIRSGTSANGALYFSDGTSGDDEYRGYLIYEHNTNALRFATNASEALRIDSSGNLLVGTTTTFSKVAIAASKTATSIGSDYNPGILNIQNSSATNGNLSLIGFQDASGFVNVAAMGAINTAHSASPNSTSGSLGFYTKPTGVGYVSEQMRLDSSGRLLVGTSTSPTADDGVYARLVVQGNHHNGDSGDAAIYIQRGESPTQTSSGDPLGTLGFSYAGGITAASIVCRQDGNSGTNDHPSRLSFNTCADGASSPTERMRIDSSGRIGIKTFANGSLYDGGDDLVLGDGGDSHQGMTIYTGTSHQGIICFADGTSGAAQQYAGYLAYYHAEDRLFFGTAGAERMRITSTGRIRANRTTEVFGEKYTFHNDEGTSGFALNQASTADHTGMLIRHARGGLSGFTAGIMGFYGNDSTKEGSITMGVSSVSYNTSSDYRLKENQQNIVDGIERVKRLSPYRFNFIKDPNTTVDGFFAHEAQDVVPEAVTGEKDGEEMQGIDHSKIVPLLTAALQEAITKIETLESKIETLESEVASLKG